MRSYRVAFLGLFLVLAGCVPLPKPMTPLEIQSMQSREYDQGKDVVFASVMSVFQDLGYIIKTANKDTGLITAESAATSDSFSVEFSGVTNVSQTYATAFIEVIGKKTRVRLNFVVSDRQSSAQGQFNRQDTPILDAKVYQNAFERIENAIFVRTSSN